MIQRAGLYHTIFSLLEPQDTKFYFDYLLGADEIWNLHFVVLRFPNFPFPVGLGQHGSPIVIQVPNLDEARIHYFLSEIGFGVKEEIGHYLIGFQAHKTLINTHLALGASLGAGASSNEMQYQIILTSLSLNLVVSH